MTPEELIASLRALQKKWDESYCFGPDEYARGYDHGMQSAAVDLEELLDREDDE